jgi:hypothetical protein
VSYESLQRRTHLENGTGGRTCGDGWWDDGQWRDLSLVGWSRVPSGNLRLVVEHPDIRGEPVECMEKGRDTSVLV